MYFLEIHNGKISTIIPQEVYFLTNFQDKIDILLEHLKELEEIHNKIIYRIENDESVSGNEWKEIEQLDNEFMHTLAALKWEIT